MEKKKELYKPLILIECIRVLSALILNPGCPSYKILSRCSGFVYGHVRIYMLFPFLLRIKFVSEFIERKNCRYLGSVYRLYK